MRQLVVSVLLLMVSVTGPHAQQAIRDLRTEATGTGVISGVVQTAGEAPRPLRLSVVTLTGDGLLAARDFRTGADGRFEFRNLPPGRYALSAYRSNYIRTAYGARRPGGTGASIVLAAGEQARDLTIPLSLYSAISGTIYDQDGQPAEGVAVEVLQYTMRTGRRTLSSVYGRPQFTDDRGVYRSGGLTPGQYFIVAGPSAFDASRGAMQLLEGREVDRVLQSANPVVATPVQTYAPVFFPGTRTLAAATPITLGLGEERDGVDIGLQFVPAGRIVGTVTDVNGQPAPHAQIVATMVTEAFTMDLFRGTIGSKSPDGQGRFAYEGLSPGQYVITARTSGADARWAMAELQIVNGEEQAVSLALQPMLTVSGRVVFAGTTLRPPASPAGVRVSLQATESGAVSVAAPPVVVNPDGTFVVSGVSPGQYRITASAPASPAGWALRSAVVEGVDTLDTPHRVTAPVTDAVVTFTDAPTQLSGVLQTSAGDPTSQYFIIVFSADRALIRSSARRSVMARPDTAGRYVVRNLPPGDYHVAAVTDVEVNAWLDPAFLDELLPMSTRITFVEGEQKTLDLRIARDEEPASVLTIARSRR